MLFVAKIGLFYLIFYSCLAGFFAVMLTGFFATLSDEHPKQTGLLSLIKGNPGIAAFTLVMMWSAYLTHLWPLASI